MGSTTEAGDYRLLIADRCLPDRAYEALATQVCRHFMEADRWDVAIETALAGERYLLAVAIWEKVGPSDEAELRDFEEEEEFLLRGKPIWPACVALGLEDGATTWRALLVRLNELRRDRVGSAMDEALRGELNLPGILWWCGPGQR